MAKVAQATVFLNAELGHFQKGMAQARREFRATIGNITKLADNAGKNMMKFGAGLGAGLLLAGNKARTFNQAMREVNTLLELSEEDFESLKLEVRDLAKEMGLDVVYAIGAMYQAVSAGVPKENIISFLRLGAEAAIGGVTDIKTAVDGATTVVNAFGKEMSEVEDVLDTMFVTMKGGKTTIGELSRFMFQVAPIANAMGVSFEEIAAHLIALTKQGTPTSVAMTQVRAEIISFANPTKQMVDLLIRSADELKKNGVISGEVAQNIDNLAERQTNLNGYLKSGALTQAEYNKSSKALNDALRDQFKEMAAGLIKAEGLGGALELLADKTNSSKVQMKEALGSTESFQAAMGVTGEKAGVLAKSMEDVANRTGASKKAFAEMDKDRHLEKIKAELNDMALSIGEAVLPSLKSLAESMQPILERVAAWIKENPKLFEGLLKLSGVLLIGGALLRGVAALGSNVAIAVNMMKRMHGGAPELGMRLIALSPKLGAVAIGAAKFAGALGLVAGSAGIGWAFGRWIDGMIDTHLPRFATAIDGFMDKLVGLIDRLRQFLGLTNAAGSGLGDRSLQLINEGSLPRNANGTRNFGGGLTVVGERGPEIINVPRGTEILSNDRSRGLLHNMAQGGMGSITQVFNISRKMSENEIYDMMRAGQRAAMRMA